jgi:hypothetical protein
MEVGDKEGNVVALYKVQFQRQLPRNEGKHPSSSFSKLTGIAFLLKMIKPSALIVMNLVNCLHKIRSISSACLIQIDNRIEFTDGSMRTFSNSFREIVSAFRRTSGDVLCESCGERDV